MGIATLLNRLLFFHMPTVAKILLIGNISFCVLVAVYRSGRESETDGKRLRWFAYSKGFQAVTWLLLLLDDMPYKHIAIFIANTMLYFGLYCESRVMLDLSRFSIRMLGKIQAGIFVFILVGSDIVSFFVDDIMTNIAYTSTALFVILLLPGIAFVLSVSGSPLRKLIGGLYMLLFCFSFFRTYNILFRNAVFDVPDIFLNNIGIFIFILILFIGGPGFLLLVKEDADRHIRNMAFSDHLTGLLNRRRFLDEAAVILDHHARYGENLSVIFMDIDHFKNINDTYGHRFGDDVLKDFAKILADSVRLSDLCCRYGGEEFLLLLSNTNAFLAVIAAKRIQAALSLSKFSQNQQFKYTVSAGVFSAVPEEESGLMLESFIEKSDKALYRAKKNGRNRVEVFDESEFSGVQTNFS